VGKSRMLASSGCDVEDVLWSDELDCKDVKRLTMASAMGTSDVRGIVSAIIVRWNDVSGGSTCAGCSSMVSSCWMSRMKRPWESLC